MTLYQLREEEKMLNAAHDAAQAECERLSDLINANQVAAYPEIAKTLLEERRLSKISWKSVPAPRANPGTFNLHAVGLSERDYGDLQELCSGNTWLSLFNLGPDSSTCARLEFMDGDLYLTAPTLKAGFKACKVHHLVVDWSYLSKMLSDQRQILDEHVFLLEQFIDVGSK